MADETPTPDWVPLETKLTEYDHRRIDQHTELYHVGDLETERSKPHHSQEGGELSVSHHPDAWREIARIGGDTYELENPDGRFYGIDPHTSVTDTEYTICKDNGYIDDTTGYKVERYDPEWDETRYRLFYDRDRAESHATEYDDSTLTEVTVPHLEVKGETYWEDAFTQSPSDASPVGIRLLIPIWAASELPIDGIYWHHPLEPHKYNAPRGLIYQEKLGDWRITNLDTDVQIPQSRQKQLGDFF